jgi:hypothetical protein
LLEGNEEEEPDEANEPQEKQIEINMNDPHLKSFEANLEEEFKKFSLEVANRFKSFKEEYLQASKERIDEKEKENALKRETNNQKIETFNDQQQKFNERAENLLQIYANLANHKRTLFDKYMAICDWREFVNQKKKAKRVYSVIRI